MIVGAPRVIERDGQALLVDECGEELVCRIDSEKRCSRVFHRVDLAAFQADGTIRPVCDFRGRTATWQLKRREVLAPLWDSCTFAACFGEYDGTEKHWQDQSLTTRLKRLSVEEFDELVERR